MPVVKKVRGGRVYVRRVGQEFEIGDRAEVSADDADYLCEERGDFRHVDDGDSDAADDEDICGAELSSGGTCDRPAAECPYHGDETREA